MPDQQARLKGTWMTEGRTRLMTALVGVALTLLAGLLCLFRLGGSIRTLSYDIPFRYHHAAAADDVCIVYIDELDGRFVDRRAQAKLLDALNASGARAVVYDLIFDRASEEPEVDREFAAAILRFRGVDENWQPVEGLPRRQVLLACGRQTIKQTGVSGEQLIPPTDELLAAADDFGLVTLIHDKRFTVRELTTGSRDEATMTWKAAVGLGAPLEEGERLRQRWLNYAGPPDPDHPAIRSLSASDLLIAPAPALLRDKVVVVGAKPGIVGAAAGLDLFSTPYHRFDIRGELPLTSGVEIQATGLANLLHGDWLVRSEPRHDRWLVVAAGLLAGVAFTRLRPLHGLAVAILGILLMAGLGIWTMHAMRLWFPWSVVAFVQIPVAFVWGTAAHFYVERFFRVKLSEEQRQLREAFAKYVSPEMLDQLKAQGFRMKTGGEKVEAAVVFTDLANFTDMCERVGDPEKIVATLNDYFERTTCHIFDHDGVVIKFIGDAILAVWGAPLPEPDAALKAARAAWKLSRDASLDIHGTTLGTRIGVHFGELVAGNIGSSRRVDYTLIGDPVNLAARLESLNKMLGTKILVSGEVRERIGDEFHTRMVGWFKVKGRREATVIHELLGQSADGPRPGWVGTYDQAQAALQANDPGRARELFQQVVAERHGEDGSSRFFLQRLDSGDPVRDGYVEMTEK
ncbi:adenylate/guanylate cyclase domain-containing protein [Luteolibacter marinus]|uniref:adenylate/guanylate cyclase domain-containing protein n=1 Tax=Luteolibacter marinus TaxID=2776705 RepID=UPI0018695520|nr:adenylate/guanylate cyclase domain-containing protein [Luteolibacter marinus]